MECKDKNKRASKRKVWLLLLASVEMWIKGWFKGAMWAPGPRWREQGRRFSPALRNHAGNIKMSQQGLGRWLSQWHTATQAWGLRLGESQHSSTHAQSYTWCKCWGRTERDFPGLQETCELQVLQTVKQKGIDKDSSQRQTLASTRKSTQLCMHIPHTHVVEGKIF